MVDKLEEKVPLFNPTNAVLLDISTFFFAFYNGFSGQVIIIINIYRELLKICILLYTQP